MAENGEDIGELKGGSGVQERGEDLEGGDEDPPKTEIVEGGKKLKDKKGRYFDGFPCTLCPKVFSRTINLKAHLQAHEDGECLADGSRVRKEKAPRKKRKSRSKKALLDVLQFDTIEQALNTFAKNENNANEKSEKHWIPIHFMLSCQRKDSNPYFYYKKTKRSLILIICMNHLHFIPNIH